MSTPSSIAASLGITTDRELDIIQTLEILRARGKTAPDILNSTILMDPDERALIAYYVGIAVDQGKILPE